MAGLQVVTAVCRTVRPRHCVVGRFTACNMHHTLKLHSTTYARSLVADACMAQQLLTPLLRGPGLLIQQRPLTHVLRCALVPFAVGLSHRVSPATQTDIGRGFLAPTAGTKEQEQDKQQQQPQPQPQPRQPRPTPLGRVPAACGPTLPVDGDSSSSNLITQPGDVAGTGPAPSSSASPASLWATTAASSCSSSSPQTRWPWDLIASLPRSAPFQVPLLSTAPLSSYLTYLAAARQGMLSILDMGVVRQDGQAAREQLALREAVLRQLVDIHPVCGQDDEELGDLSPQQLQRVAAAATAAGSEVTGEEVEAMVMDYFVAKRCWELMHAQRTLRTTCHKQYPAGQQQQAQPSSTGPERGRRRRSQQRQQPSAAEAGEDWQQLTQQLPQLHPDLSLEDQLATVGDMPIWDAFHDADLGDLLVYIQAALDGMPSIYLPFGSQQQALAAGSQEQQQGLQQLRVKLKGAVRLLKALSPQQRAKPLVHIGEEDLPRLADKAHLSEEEVRGLLEDFYRLKRLGFSMALQALQEALVRSDTTSDDD